MDCPQEQITPEILQAASFYDIAWIVPLFGLPSPAYKAVHVAVNSPHLRKTKFIDFIKSRTPFSHQRTSTLMEHPILQLEDRKDQFISCWIRVGNLSCRWSESTWLEDAISISWHNKRLQTLNLVWGGALFSTFANPGVKLEEFEFFFLFAQVLNLARLGPSPWDNYDWFHEQFNKIRNSY